MEYRRLGGSDVSVSVVTLGTWAIGGWMWGGTDEKKAIEAIHASIDLGVTSIDTAPAYGFGTAERIVGQAIKGRRDKVQILTKYGLRWDTTEGEFFFDSRDAQGQPARMHRFAGKKSVLWECEQCLRRLGVDEIDLFQCHWRDHTTPVEETMEAIASLLEQGKIRAAGVSNFTPEEMQAARQVVPLACDQPPYSMVKREAEKDVLPWCRENNVGVIVYSPLQLGLLSGRVTLDRAFPRDDLRSSSPYFRPENRKRVLAFLDELRPIAEGHKATLAQLVINWTIRRPGITAALVGARDAQQAKENAGAAAFRLSKDETRRIDELVDGLKLEV